MLHSAFELKHWQVVELGEARVLEGHICGRPEFPDGMWIQTSGLVTWETDDDNILFHTRNSTYICSIREYILSGNTLGLLCDPGLESMMAMAEELRRDHCLTFLAEAGERDVVLLSWEGCDCPYLKWAASVCNRRVDYVETTSSGSWVSANLTFDEGKFFSVVVPASASTHISMAGPEYTKLPVYIENTGEKSVTCLINGRNPVYVAPGDFVAAG